MDGDSLVTKTMLKSEWDRLTKNPDPPKTKEILTAQELVRATEEDRYKYVNMDRIKQILRELEARVSNPEEDDIKYGFVETDRHPTFLTGREQQLLREKGYDIVVEERGFDMCGSPKSARLYVSCKLKY